MEIKPNIFEQFDKLYTANENSYAERFMSGEEVRIF